MKIAPSVITPRPATARRNSFPKLGHLMSTGKADSVAWNSRKPFCMMGKGDTSVRNIHNVTTVIVFGGHITFFS